MNKKKVYIIGALLSLLISGCNNQHNISTPSNLEAIGHDKAVSLAWEYDAKATSYYIYKDDEKINEVDVPFTTINNLDNGADYRFGVAKNVNGNISDIKYVNAKPQSGITYDPMIDRENTPIEKQIGLANIKKMYKSSNINSSSTNLYRYKQVLKNMKEGKEQTVAYIGGSISVGEKAKALDQKNHQKGYAYYSYQWIKNHFDTNRNSKFINASISGTDSSIATVRLEKDVLQYNPNLVFVEFAANNGTTDYDKKTYESLIRRILNQENKPAVVLLFSAVSYANNEQKYMIPIGNYYNLPMVSFFNAMSSVCENLSESRTDSIFMNFTEDGVHPNDEGHLLYAKVITYVLDLLAKTNKEYDEVTVPTAPSQSGYNAYENFTFINNNTNNNLVVDTGSFVASDTSTRVTKETADVEAFQNGWKKSSKTENNEMIIKVRCRSFFVIYQAGNDYIENDPKGNMVFNYQHDTSTADKGTLKWDVSRTNKQISYLNINDNGNGWDNPCCIICIDKDVVGDYTIKINMEKVDQLGTIMAMGYCD